MPWPSSRRENMIQGIHRPSIDLDILTSHTFLSLSERLALSELSGTVSMPFLPSPAACPDFSVCQEGEGTESQMLECRKKSEEEAALREHHSN